MRLPERIKRTLRSREDGHDVVGITVSWRMVKRMVKVVKRILHRGK